MTVAALNIDPQPTLAQLLAGICEAPPLPVTGITTDSRAVRPGNAFLACRGATHHGIAFRDQAIAAGAAVVLWDGDTAALPAADLPVPMIEVPGLARHLGDIANRFFGEPSKDVKVAGITGTNGKTSVAWLIARCMQHLGHPCAYLGTLGAGLETLDATPGLTTPACVDLHRTIAGFRAEGAGWLALEVSSHAIGQQRIDGVYFDSALFTNLSRDHVDYHGSMQAYGETKAGFVLREDIPRRIVNVDDTFGRDLAGRSRGDVRRVTTAASRSSAAPFVRLQAVACDDRGTSVRAETAAGDAAFHLPLVGEFNIANAALVLAQLLCWDLPIVDAAAALAAVGPPPGRLQRVSSGPDVREPAVYVDYAHTPGGLEAVLEALRAHCAGRLWCVFGCGGDRDRGKRPLMGEVVARLADRAVVTNDNPRSEPPDRIIAAILDGMGEGVTVIEDRARAIAFATEQADPGDVVLIAGKGHETFQIMGERRVPFSDYAVARSCLGARARAGGRAR